MKAVFIYFIIALYAAIWLCGGCALRSNTADGMTTYDGVSSDYPGAAQSLADKTAQELSRRYPPGHTSIAIVAAPSGNFSESLEASLRRQGFAVRPSGQYADVRVAYTLDSIQGESSCYLQVKTSDGGSFGYARELTPELGRPVTVPPSSGVVYADAPKLESRPLPESVAMPAKSAAVPQHAVNSKSTAAKIAKRNSVPVADFCRWNGVTPDTVLESGRKVYLSEPASSAPSAPLLASAAPISQASSAPVTPVAAVPISAPIAPVAANPAPAPAPMPAAPQAPAPTLVASAAPVSVSSPSSTPVMRDASTIRPIPVVVTTSEAAPLPVAKPVAEEKPLPPVLPEPAVKPLPEKPLPLAESKKPSSQAAPITPIAAAPVSAPLPKDDGIHEAYVPQSEWSIEPGTLRAQITAWTARAGYQLVWKASHDYDMDSHARFQGDFVGAVKNLFTGLQHAGFPLRVTLYKGNNVMEVSEN